MIALVGCPRRAALVAQIGEWNAREARECRSDDRRVDDRGRGSGVYGSAGDLVSGDPLVDRRQAAREAGHDAYADVCVEPSSYERAKNAIDDAIEVATRVKITPEIVAAARAGWAAPESAGNWLTDPGPRETARLVAAFRAAGFEVVE